MNNGTTAPPGYVLPSCPRWQGGWNIRALLGAVVVCAMAASAATQWLAAQLNNPVEMGEPIVWFHGTAVFPPFEAPCALERDFAGTRLISSTVRKEIWIAFGATRFWVDFFSPILPIGFLLPERAIVNSTES